VIETPIKLRDPGSVLGFAEHMIRDYSRNSLAVREQREEMFTCISRERDLRQGFGVTSTGTFINP
jgi:hypothetical protein